MPQEKPLVIDMTKEDDILQILDSGALLSSNNANWDGIHLGYYHAPPHEELPECYMKQHIIVIHSDDVAFASPNVSERRMDGCFESEQLVVGDIMLCPAHVSHWCYTEKEGEYIALSLEPQFLARVAYESINPETVELVPHFAKPDRLIHQIGLALKSVLETDPLGSRFYAQSMTAALSAHLLQHYSAQKYTLKEYTGGLPRYKLEQAIALIHERLNEDLSLEAIASVLGMSQYYFCRLFKQSMGITPYQYLTVCRIEKAKQLLKQQELPLVEVAFCCGFANQSSFTQKFRQIVGTTPKAYRQQKL